MYFAVSYISKSIYIHYQEANALDQAAEHDSASGSLILSSFAGRSVFSSFPLSTDWSTQIKYCLRRWLYEKQLDIWGTERASHILFNLTQIELENVYSFIRWKLSQQVWAGPNHLMNHSWQRTNEWFLVKQKPADKVLLCSWHNPLVDSNQIRL